MVAPQAEVIESAAVTLKDVPEFIRTNQVKELQEFGDEAARKIGASGVSHDFMAGYELGLQVARAIFGATPSL